MADYDSAGVFYDSGVLYDAADVPQTERKRMAKVKLGLSGMTPDEVVSLANQIKTAMTGNATFPSPNPTLAALGTATATATTKVAAQKAAVQTAKQATDDRDAAITALITLLTSLASHVENVSSGDAVKIESAGMSVKAPNAPIGALTQVTNLAITAGDDEGELEMTWDPVRGAKSYEIQTSTDPNVPANWRMLGAGGKSKKTLKAMTTGTRIWARVRAVAPKEENNGPWSDPATKIVP